MWDHFKKEGEYGLCLVSACKARVKHCCNTSNLLKHLQSCHANEYEKCIAERMSNKKAKVSTSKQITLTESIASSRKYPRDSIRCKRLDNALVEMIAADLQPPSIVEDHGFLNYTSLLDPRYQPPSRRTLARRIIPEKYDKVRSSVKERIKAVPKALTTDIWSSRQSLSYCCLTAHAISESWEAESYILETFNFNNEHTAQHIAQELTRVVNDWGLPSISCCVTDNASNIVAGIIETGWRHLPCYAHTLNLVVQKSIRMDPIISQPPEQM